MLVRDFSAMPLVEINAAEPSSRGSVEEFGDRFADETTCHADLQRDVWGQNSASDCIPENAVVSQQLPRHSYRTPESFSGQIAALDHGVDL